MEQLITKKELVVENTTTIIKLLQRLISYSTEQSFENSLAQNDVSLFILNDFCQRLLNTLLTGNAERGLIKRDPLQKRRKDSKKAAYPLTKEQVSSLLEIL